jgi:hypothetical protein
MEELALQPEAPFILDRNHHTQLVSVTIARVGG